MTRPEDRVVHSAYVPDHDHAHDDEALSPIEENPIWRQDNVTLHSVGIDIGSSGTQVVFSKLEMRGPGEIAALRGRLRARETLYMSPISLTPFRDTATIDEDRLWAIVEAAFQAAGLTPDDIETGAVILTGVAARRDNARAITLRLAEEVGELVCATAGDHMEAQLAAYGSGAVEASRADLARAGAEADNAQRELQRNRELLATHAISESTFRRVETDARSASDAQRAARARLQELLHGTRPEQIDQAEATLAERQAENDLVARPRRRVSAAGGVAAAGGKARDVGKVAEGALGLAMDVKRAERQIGGEGHREAGAAVGPRHGDRRGRHPDMTDAE